MNHTGQRRVTYHLGIESLDLGALLVHASVAANVGHGRVVYAEGEQNSGAN